MLKAIEFIHRWRGREPGSVDTKLDGGVATLLVQRGIARWREEQEKQEPALRKPLRRLGRE